jgi:ABC-type glycerol-3-phosphate transport system substrate-binding protein
MENGDRELGHVIVPGAYPGEYIYNRSGYYITPSVLYAISVNTENPKESGRFLNYLINDDYFATLQGNDKGFPINDYVFRNIDKDAASFSYDAYLRMESDEERMQLEHPGMEDPDAVLAFERAYNAVLKGVDPDIEAAALYNELRTIWK